MNKLIARVVAVVMAVMMLGTVSFAAATLSETNDVIDATKAEITDLTSGVYTVKAYTDVTNTIVAMYQGVKPESIKINPAKIAAEDNNVVVEFNGIDGTKKVVNYAVNRAPEVVEGAVDVAPVYEFNGIKYTGVAHVTNTFIPTGVAKKIGYILTAAGEGVTGAENVVEYNGTISGNGEVEFDVVVLSVPENVTISAKSFIEY